MTIENDRDILGLMTIGKICAEAMSLMAEHLKPGITTKELDDIGAAYLKKKGARSAPILAYNFPGHTCISINDEAAHGIPGNRVIQAGDLVNIDVSAEKDGYWGDTGRSFPVPPVTPKVQALVDAAEKALEIALETARAGIAISEIGRLVEGFARQNGFEVIEELGGHGVGRNIHEKPSIPFHHNRRAKQRLTEGLVITLEPFLTYHERHIKTMPDGWTLKTKNGGLSAQFEHTVVITKQRPLIMTAL
jgi:methionyl aminopeptidase